MTYTMRSFSIYKRMNRLKYLLESKNVPEFRKEKYEQELIMLQELNKVPKWNTKLKNQLLKKSH